jgi:glycosyltransferase involved in cell wall biosynthesis
MKRWVLIAGDFTPLGGMDRANHALAVELAARGAEVHLVTHRASQDLRGRPSVHVHDVPRPFGSHLFGAPFLAAAGERWARRLTGEGTRVVANGGNADGGDVSWVHHLNAAHRPLVRDSAKRRIKARVARHYFERRDLSVLRRARVVVCNSRRTASDVVAFAGIPESRVRTVYYGTDAAGLSLVTPEERASARRDLGCHPDRRVAVFVGALGDDRKGFDRLFDAWQRLCSDPSWDVDLAVAGAGAAADGWRRRASVGAISGRVQFLGFRTDIPRVLAAADLLVHPARYEAYGLGAHEALCRGIPAMINGTAGVAELYPHELQSLLVHDVESRDELVERLKMWRADERAFAARVRPFADRLRSRSWHDMAGEFVRAVEA